MVRRTLALFAQIVPAVAVKANAKDQVIDLKSVLAFWQAWNSVRDKGETIASACYLATRGATLPGQFANHQRRLQEK
jgi:hypothetical protein